MILFSTLLALGLRMPRDVSLLTFGSDQVLTSFRPVISHYMTSERSMTPALARMIRSLRQLPPPTPVLKLLQTEYVAGESVGPAP